jgi:hypothetical protein
VPFQSLDPVLEGGLTRGKEGARRKGGREGGRISLVETTTIDYLTTRAKEAHTVRMPVSRRFREWRKARLDWTRTLSMSIRLLRMEPVALPFW